LSDRGHRRLHCRVTLFFRFSVGGDAEDDGCLARVDAHCGPPASTDQVGQHRFDLAFTGPKTIDPAIPA